MNKLATVLGILIFGITLFNIHKLHEVNSKLEDFYFVDKYEEPEPEIIFLDSLIYDTVFVETTEIVKLPIIDTVFCTDTLKLQDSIFVEVPISIYNFDTTLNKTHINLICEGFNVRLNSLLIERINVAQKQEKAVNKWYNNLGFGVGLGVTYVDRFRFVPTLGVYYKLF